MVQRHDQTDARADPGLYRFLRRSLSRLRWVTLAALLLITLIQPQDSRVGLPTWALVAAFAGYNLLLGLIGQRPAGLRFLAWAAVLDLPVAAFLYILDGDPGGPLFILFFLAVDSAAAGMTLRGTLLYTGASLALVALIDPTLPRWATEMDDLRGLVTRLIALALVGAGMALVTRRLALEHEASRRIEGEAERLELLDRLRSGFLSTVSHDLRTPLTAARAGLGMLETSITDRLRPDEGELLGNVRRNVERLNLLIDDLLAFNQLEAGTLRLDHESLDLREVAADAMAAVHSLMQEKGQTLEVDLPVPLPARGDARRLEQVVMNLLANAHLHTPAGTRIILSGRAIESEVRLDVSDSGPGIPAEELEAVFQRFHRLGSTESGSGLGLAIARALVELHGGRVWAVSAAGEGTTIHLALPRATTGGDDEPEAVDR